MTRPTIPSNAVRPLDVTFVIDQMLAGAAGLIIDPEHIGMSRHSIGGWTTLKSVETDARIKEALPLAAEWQRD